MPRGRTAKAQLVRQRVINQLRAISFHQDTAQKVPAEITQAIVDAGGYQYAVAHFGFNDGSVLVLTTRWDRKQWEAGNKGYVHFDATAHDY